MSAPQPRTLVDKIWDDHVVSDSPGAPTVLGIDLHLVHEVTSPQAFTGLRARGLAVRRPGQTVATADHSIPTHDRSLPIADAMAAAQVQMLTDNCQEFGIPLHGIGTPNQGIVHIIGPEMGLTQPGMTIVCGDSHTATHGAFGALAFGIGTSEVEMVLATQCLLQRRPKTYEVRIDGRLSPGVGAKDIILALIARIGVGGGTGHVFEYTGEAIRALTMEQRMTVCNMSIEGGARAGLIAPDETTFDYVAGRPFAPSGRAWDEALDRWRSLPTDEGATYDRSIALNASTLEPMVTYGTNPGMGIPITGRIPSPEDQPDPGQRRALERSLEYMALTPGEPILGRPVDVVFIGSCTNGRISDLRLAASVMRDRKVAAGVRVMVVPGSQEVKKEAENEGLADIFRAAGAEWREAGCSMCIAMNGDQLNPGQYAISTSNRNFEGRQGKGGRSFLASPLTAAAAALTGVVSDPRTLPGIDAAAGLGGR
ncbi:MAG: 3-isopropylmalate/(R)-2-methylmalate dehydratase large subunit [Chloroflexota bacterium]|jgi:3-isopropylmalate/(R)-2-methylmalate dehydratase large subunit|nr:3-isopropylmalate/(R)-2-methylmalate dehydratase large subunit [Chloroflexota bacterium]